MAINPNGRLLDPYDTSTRSEAVRAESLRVSIWDSRECFRVARSYVCLTLRGDGVLHLGAPGGETWCFSVFFVAFRADDMLLVSLNRRSHPKAHPVDLLDHRSHL